MDITNLVLSISLGTLLTIAGIVIAFLGYRLNKKKHEEDLAKQREDALKQAVADARKEDAEKKDIAIQLTEIKLELVHIRERQDEEIKLRQDHEKRIQALERTCKKMKGGK